jgi:hypothetical protein
MDPQRRKMRAIVNGQNSLHKLAVVIRSVKVKNVQGYEEIPAAYLGSVVSDE